MKNPKISFIAAISRKDRGMGYQGKIQWHISADWKRFKVITKDHVVIMGRKTIESMGKTLPDRINIVVTRDESYVFPNAIIVHSIDEALRQAQGKLGELSEEFRNEIFIIGGGELFTQAIDKADKLYLTLVDGDYPADAHFPDYSDFKKVVYDKREESDGYTYEYVDLER